MTVVESIAPLDLRGNQRPGLLHLPDGTDAYIDDALYLCGEWGFGYDEAQEFVLGSALREQADGRWAAKEVGLEMPRQNGKGELVEGREALGLFFLDERKLIHSAHEFATASEALDRMDDRIGRNPTLKHRVKTVKRSHGEEGVYLKDGRKLLYKTRTKGGGRGFGADFLLLDEAMFIAESFLSALMPVISARPNPQMWYMGSAVYQETMENGVVFSRLRRRALDGDPGRMAYMGWSAAYEANQVLFKTPEDVPRDVAHDPALIARANPALGIRIDLEHVMETEFRAMSHASFCVERLGVGDWPETAGEAGRVISDAAWAAVLDAASAAAGSVCFAIDTKPDRSVSTIAAAGVREDGLAHIEVIEHRPGTGWVVDRVVALVGAHENIGVVIDEGGPAGSLISDLEDAGVKVIKATAREYAQAYGRIIDAIRDLAVRHIGTVELRSAVRGAVKRPLGEAWAWSRKSSDVDISPLVACTLALWGAETQRPSEPGFEVLL